MIDSRSPSASRLTFGRRQQHLEWQPGAKECSTAPRRHRNSPPSIKRTRPNKAPPRMHEQRRADNNHQRAAARSGATNSDINGAAGSAAAAAAAAEDGDEDNDNENENANEEDSSAGAPTLMNVGRPLILITGSGQTPPASQVGGAQSARGQQAGASEHERRMAPPEREQVAAAAEGSERERAENDENDENGENEDEEVVDGIRYRIVAAVTAPPAGSRRQQARRRPASFRNEPSGGGGGMGARFASQVRRKSSALVANLLQSVQAAEQQSQAAQRPRRLSIYEMTKSPPPETSLEVYLSERRRSSTISAKQLQQQLEQQSTFQTNYNQRQQYFKDLNRKLINQDKKLLNVVANRGQIHRHSVDIAQLPLNSAILQANKVAASLPPGAASGQPSAGSRPEAQATAPTPQPVGPINQAPEVGEESSEAPDESRKRRTSNRHLVAIRENDGPFSSADSATSGKFDLFIIRCLARPQRDQSIRRAQLASSPAGRSLGQPTGRRRRGEARRQRNKQTSGSFD